MCGGKKWNKAEAPHKVSEPISLPFIQIWQLSVTGSHLFNSPTWVGHTFGHLREETEDHLNVVNRREDKSACLFVCKFTPAEDKRQLGVGEAHACMWLHARVKCSECMIVFVSECLNNM